MITKDRIFVIIPCYNEGSSICNTVENLLCICPNVTAVVVDDGSSDNSVEQVQSIEDERVILLCQPFNCGIGTTVETGLLYAKRHHATYAVKFDGDGQHLAEEIELLLQPLQNHQADMTVGSRFLIKNEGFKSTFSRRIGIRFFQILCKCLTGKKMTDCTSGFRAYNTEALDFISKNYPAFDYPEPEENILLLKNHFRLQEVPCKMNIRQGGKSSIRLWKAFYYMIKVSLAMIMAAFRPTIRRRTQL